MLTEANRREIFAACPMLEGFLGTLLEDLQHNEADSCEERDTGTIWTCPDATFNAARAICDAFAAAAPIGESWLAAEQLGSDLYLEAAGHGAGFRDRQHDSDPDTSREIGERLSAAVVSRIETYIGDDGCAYIVGRELVA